MIYPENLVYLSVYNDDIKNKVCQLLSEDKLADFLLQKYAYMHEINTDKALYAYVVELKNQFMRNASLPSKVMFDNDIRAIRRALGMNSNISRVQGGKLKAKTEIRIAALFKSVPPEFLRMIAVHELAHLKEKDHNKAFYQLCVSMEPDYHQIEFDLRLYLTQRDLKGEIDWKSGHAK